VEFQRAEPPSVSSLSAEFSLARLKTILGDVSEEFQLRLTFLSPNGNRILIAAQLLTGCDGASTRLGKSYGWPPPEAHISAPTELTVTEHPATSFARAFEQVEPNSIRVLSRRQASQCDDGEAMSETSHASLLLSILRAPIAQECRRTPVA
jgi:hypothetical protein